MTVVMAGGKLLVSQFKPDQVITVCDCPYFGRSLCSST
jgi:hypothetical protein